MNVLILNGSPRKTGVTSKILGRMADQLGKVHTVESVFIHDKNIKPCIGCLGCRPDKRCVLKEDDGHRIAGMIQHAELLIVASPVYWGNMPGHLKVMFDRLVPVFEYIEGLDIRKQQKGKKAIILTVSASPFPFNRLPSQGSGTVRSVKTILRAGGYKIVRIFNIPDSANFGLKQRKFFNNMNHFLSRSFHS